MGGFAWGAIFGKYLDAWGARVSCLVGATGLGAGWGLAGLASSGALPPGLALPALYTGGLLWGLANGFAYVPPVSNLLQWFPSSKGFASGMCIAGYGTGAMITSAAAYRLINHFRVAPEYLGKLGDVPTQVRRSFLLFASLSHQLLLTRTSFCCSRISDADDRWRSLRGWRDERGGGWGRHRRGGDDERADGGRRRDGGRRCQVGGRWP
jgi:MFS family permease